ncbi:heterokaryon incompatibility protein-domain-containing protein [Xylaria scruposa]|nr:heterokaryon incompatibility protein-domain-containing protein [Xylaria scruposa]
MAEDIAIEIHDLSRRRRPLNRPPSFSSAQLYESLRVDEGSIRVLDLEPEPLRVLRRLVDPPLRGTLRVVSTKDCPDFSALSYVWGSKANPPDVLLCNGCEIEITTNCKDALRAVRKSQGRITIWVDAICINQKDPIEKALQIPNMEDIYTWARMVYVWLGRGNWPTNWCMKMMREASRESLYLTGNRILHADCRLAGRGGPGYPWTLCKEDLKDFWTFIKSKMIWKNLRMLEILLKIIWKKLSKLLVFLHPYLSLIIWETDNIAPLASYDGHRRSPPTPPQIFDDLLSGPWISRAWTFQELILAQDVTIMCGKHSLDWDHFVRGMRMYWDYGTQPDETLNLNGPDMVYLRQWYELIALWMSIKRKTAWGTRKMRCDHAGRATMENHQSPILLRSFGRSDRSHELWRHSDVRPLILCRPFILNEKGVILGARWVALLIAVLISFLIVFSLPITLFYLHDYIYNTIPRLVFDENGQLLNGQPVNERTRFAINFKTASIATVTVASIIWFWYLLDLFLRSPQRVTLRNGNEKKIDAFDELVRVLPQVTKYRSATEPRDRVYATYGILRSFDIQLSAIDYTKSENQVYFDFFSDLLQSSPKYLIFLIDAGLSDDANLPSWIPNWETALERSWLPSEIYDTGRSKVTIESAQPTGKTLRVQGILVCPAGFSTETFGEIKNDREDELVVILERPVATLCQLIHRARDLSFNPAYETITKSILQTINAFKSESEQFTEFNSFSNLYDKIRDGLRGAGDAQVDYMAISSQILQQYSHGPEYQGLADLFNKFANRSLFDTHTGYIGSGPPRMKAGDLVVYVSGISIPLIFRETEALDTYLLIGPAFVLGLKEDDLGLPIKEFTLV